MKSIPHCSQDSRVESVLWFKVLNQLKIQELNRACDSIVESAYESI